MRHIPIGALLLGALAGTAVAGNRGDRFKDMDTNGDGMISASEHAARVTAKFQDMDADRDGRLTVAEVDAGMKAMKSDAMGKDRMGKGMGQGMGMGMGQAMTASEKIASMDTDGDGAVSSAEHDAWARNRFTEMDGDRNGSLSHSEMGGMRDR